MRNACLLPHATNNHRPPPTADATDGEGERRGEGRVLPPLATRCRLLLPTADAADDGEGKGRKARRGEGRGEEWKSREVDKWRRRAAA